jgi:hypothetical protein
MAVFYGVPEGQTLVIRGPADVTVRGGEVPVIGTKEDIEALTPTVTSIEPDSAEMGSEDLEMVVTGTGFTENSVIVFNGGDEPTTFVSETEVSTGVKPSTAGVAGSYPVLVRNGQIQSNSATFSFTEPANGGSTRKKKARGD